MNKFEMPETDLYKELESENERKDYRNTFLKALSCFSYLEEYDEVNLSELETMDDLKNIDIEPLCKTFFSLVYLKSKIQRDKKSSKGTMNGYYEVIYNHEDTLNIIRNIIVYRDNQNNSEDFFK